MSGVYICPMHGDVRQANPGKCPHCGMNLVAEGTFFAMLRHISNNPMHLVIMAAVMVAIMAVLMVVMR